MQIFVEGKLVGMDQFLLAPSVSTGSDATQVFTGRSHWAGLLTEVLPRALLAELGLSRMLLGSSGGGGFLLVLPQEARSDAESFLQKAAAQISELSSGSLRLVWAVTENLGGWSEVRKRLRTELRARRGAPAAGLGMALFAADGDKGLQADADVAAEDYLVQQMGFALGDVDQVGWSPEDPGKVFPVGTATETVAKHQWPIATASEGAIPFARHTAPSDAGTGPATTGTLGHRSVGQRGWGVLRGDIDNVSARIARAETIEEHIRLSVMYKQFFAGELEVLCAAPEFWQKVSVLYSGGDDFAVYGAWEALLALAAELERLFQRFVETNLIKYDGPEGKTLTMALALAPSGDASLGAVFEEAGLRLEAAKSAGKDSIWLFGRRLEWKQFTEAAQLKNALGRMVEEHRCSPQYLNDLCGLYRESRVPRRSRARRKEESGARPWRYHRRIRRILNASRGSSEGAGFQKASAALIGNLIGRNTASVRLRPAGRVALEWARLAGAR